VRRRRLQPVGEGRAHAVAFHARRCRLAAPKSGTILGAVSPFSRRDLPPCRKTGALSRCHW
jgi:hypothetical protein